MWMKVLDDYRREMIIIKFYDVIKIYFWLEKNLTEVEKEKQISIRGNYCFLIGGVGPAGYPVTYL